MAIYEVFGEKDIGSKVLILEKFYGAVDAVDAIAKLIDKYSISKDKREVKITEFRVWGTSRGKGNPEGRKGNPKFDPNTLCNCHSSPLWKCPKILPAKVSVTFDGINFPTGVEEK